MRLNKPGRMNAEIGAYADRIRAIMTIGPLDFWLNGTSRSNFDLQPVVVAAEKAVAGFAAEGYER